MMRRRPSPAEVAVDFAVGSLAVYRVTRFIIRDTLIDELRQKVQVTLSGGYVQRNGEWRLSKWRQKLLELIGCPYCVSIYIAGATVLATWCRRGTRLPLVQWPAMSAAALVAWRIVEDE